MRQRLRPPAPAHAGHHGLLAQIVHHGFVALVVASAALWLKHHGLLGVVETAFLRLVSQAQASSAAPVDGARAAAVPTVLLVTDEAYESVLGQEATLDRSQLARWLTRLALDAASPPATLVVDFDLSPGPSGARSEAGQATLDDTLRRIAARGATRLVLMTPMPVATNALAEVKYRWMAALCALPAATQPAPRLQFALPYALLHQGVAMRYAPQAVSLGVVAARPAVDAAHDPCALVRQGKEAAHFLRRQSAPDAEVAGGSAPINARGLLALDARTHAIDAAPADLSGHTVFIGAGFGDVDTVITPFGPRNGVEVHAATAYSLLDPVSPASEWLAFLAEVAFGTALGFLFHASWEHARAATASLQSAATRAAFVLGYLRARGWLLGNFALLALVVVGSVYASVFAYRANLWVDPGPVVLGIFLKSLLASRVAPSAATPGPFAARAAIVDAVLWLPLVAWALLLVVTHGH